MNLSEYDDFFINEEDLKPDFEEILDSPKQSDDFFSKNEIKLGDGKKRDNKASKRNSFICSTCDEEFSKPSKLIFHAKNSHQDMKPFKCIFNSCNRSYQNKKALKVHSRSHENEKKFKCLECDAKFHVKAYLISHLRTHSGEKFQCNQCDKSFSSKSYYKQHSDSHKHPTIFICASNNCNKKFPTRFALQSHQVAVHSDTKFKCNVCTSVFKTQKNLKLHSLKHSLGNAKLFLCVVCGFNTKYRQQYNDHVRSHLATRDLICDHCNKRFIKKTLLAIHIQTHLSARNYVCEESACKKTFKTYNSYYAHKRSHNRKSSTKHICASCDRFFSSQSLLLSHQKIHTNEKTYMCHFENCSKAYTHKQNLNVHILTAHIENGMTFKCEICSKVLKNSNALRVHLKNIHKAEKVFKCTQCENSFASTQLLDVHKRMHNPKSFNCDICNYGTNYENDLKKHSVKFHNKENLE
jgi:KRAB domain-containing zinc finger protein